MNKTKTLLLSLFVFPFLLAGQLAYASPAWEYDMDHSRISFGVKHIYSTVNGYFEDFDGVFQFDPQNLAESRIEFKIKVNSIQTGISKRDSHLRTKDFFDTKEYPLITFTSSSIKHAGGDQYDVSGILTVKDVNKEVTLPFTFYGSKDHALKPKFEVAGFATSLSIDRLEYHVGNGKFLEMGVVGKTVDINVSLEVLRKK